VDAIEKLQVRSIVVMLLFRYLPIESLARTYPRRCKMGNRWSQEAQNQARGLCVLAPCCSDLQIHQIYQSITVLPRKNRLRIYVDTQDKFYRLRELKRGLSEVVVKVCYIISYTELHTSIFDREYLQYNAPSSTSKIKTTLEAKREIRNYWSKATACKNV
jgi:hypothetical protein